MRRSRLFLASMAALVTVVGLSRRALLQPSPPSLPFEPPSSLEDSSTNDSADESIDNSDDGSSQPPIPLPDPEDVEAVAPSSETSVAPPKADLPTGAPPVSPSELETMPPELPAFSPEDLALPIDSSSLPYQEALVEMASSLVVSQFSGASCEELSGMLSPTNSEDATDDPQAVMQEKAVALLKQQPDMRQAFLNQVAPPIANKMFDCDLIP